MDILLLKISDTEVINIGSGNLRSIKKIQNLINEAEIKAYEEKLHSYINYLMTADDKEHPHSCTSSLNSLEPDYPNKSIGKVLLKMVTNECGKCPEPVYENSYEIYMDGMEKKVIDQETYDKLCKMTRCIQSFDDIPEKDRNAMILKFCQDKIGNEILPKYVGRKTLQKSLKK